MNYSDTIPCPHCGMAVYFSVSSYSMPAPIGARESATDYSGVLPPPIISDPTDPPPIEPESGKEGTDVA